MIHPTAIIDPSAEIAEGVTIGPYCIIGSNVSIDAGSELKSHVVVEGHTKIGKDNLFFPFAAIGQLTQDLKYKGEPTHLIIGDHNTFRENVTIHRGTVEGTPTRIGNHNLFLCYSHVAHDCQIANHCIFSNNASVAGHCVVSDYAIISGLSGVHQFCRIGEHSIIGGISKVIQDVPPYTIVDGSPASVRGINIVGLQRRDFDEEACRALKNAYKKIFLNKKANLSEAVEALAVSELGDNEHVAILVDFLRTTERGVTR